MRSKVVEATPAARPRRSRASASCCHVAVKRESSIRDWVSPAWPKSPNHDSSDAGRVAAPPRACDFVTRGAGVTSSRSRVERTSRRQENGTAWEAAVSCSARMRLLVRGAMRLAAEDATPARKRFVTRQMNSALRTGEHGLGRTRAGARCRRCPASGTAAQQPQQHEDSDQEDDDLHVDGGARCSSTSRTKRDPTYARRSNTAPAYSQRAAIGPRQPNARRPASRPAKTIQPRIENTVL